MPASGHSSHTSKQILSAFCEHVFARPPACVSTKKTVDCCHMPTGRPRADLARSWEPSLGSVTTSTFSNWRTPPTGWAFAPVPNRIVERASWFYAVMMSAGCPVACPAFGQFCIYRMFAVGCFPSATSGRRGFSLALLVRPPALYPGVVPTRIRS